MTISGINFLDISGFANLTGILEVTFTGTDIMENTFDISTSGRLSCSFSSIVLPGSVLAMSLRWRDLGLRLMVLADSVAELSRG